MVNIFSFIYLFPIKISGYILRIDNLNQAESKRYSYLFNNSNVPLSYQFSLSKKTGGGVGI